MNLGNRLQCPPMTSSDRTADSINPAEPGFRYTRKVFFYETDLAGVVQLQLLLPIHGGGRARAVARGRGSTVDRAGAAIGYPRVSATFDYKRAALLRRRTDHRRSRARGHQAHHQVLVRLRARRDRDRHGMVDDRLRRANRGRFDALGRGSPRRRRFLARCRRPDLVALPIRPS